MEERHVYPLTVVSSAVDPGFDSWAGQTKHYKLRIYCFSAKYTVLISKRSDRLAQNLYNVSKSR